MEQSIFQSLKTAALNIYNTLNSLCHLPVDKNITYTLHIYWKAHQQVTQSVLKVENGNGCKQLWASQVALVVKNPPANAGVVRVGRPGFYPRVGKIPWRRK